MVSCQHWMPSVARVYALALGLWLLPGVASGSELSWSGPADCDQREQLVFQLERALSAPLAEVAEFQFQVHVERTSPDARARLLVRTSTEPGVSERVLVAPNCSKLVDTLTVAMALAVEAAVAEKQATTAAPAEPSPPVPSAALPAATADVLAKSADDSTAQLWSGSFWLTADGGSLPKPGLGTALGVELGWPAFQLRAVATLWLEQEARLSDRPGAGGDLALATGALLACTSALGAARAPLGLALCAGGELGRLSGSGVGVPAPRDGQSLWAAARVEADVFWSVPSTRLRLGAQLGLAVPFVRDDFVLDGIGAVHRPSSLAGRAGLGMGVTFD